MEVGWLNNESELFPYFINHQEYVLILSFKQPIKVTTFEIEILSLFINYYSLLFQ
jgi:hypothetical protein